MFNICRISKGRGYKGVKGNAIFAIYKTFWPECFEPGMRQLQTSACLVCSFSPMINMTKQK